MIFDIECIHWLITSVIAAATSSCQISTKRGCCVQQKRRTSDNCWYSWCKFCNYLTQGKLVSPLETKNKSTGNLTWTSEPSLLYIQGKCHSYNRQTLHQVQDSFSKWKNLLRFCIPIVMAPFPNYYSFPHINSEKKCLRYVYMQVLIVISMAS